ncbi:uncharacterized protein (DUF1697 family) [Actinopolyspora lacussalsi]|nr:uncharacterized protein (DUF1697 family) [Actinopolyspora lacussalsi]
MSITGTSIGYAALLRGINVGGNTKVGMQELRELAGELGLSDIRTHVNSGNLVFRSASDDGPALAEQLEKAIEQRFERKVSCLVRDNAYLRRVIEDNPFPEAAKQGKLVHATFLSETLPEERVGRIDPTDFHPEEFRLGDHVIYLHLPNGMGRSKLAETMSSSTVMKNVIGTTRNWNTVIKLAEMTE